MRDVTVRARPRTSLMNVLAVTKARCIEGIFMEFM